MYLKGPSYLKSKILPKHIKIKENKFPYLFSITKMSKLFVRIFQYVGIMLPTYID